MIIKSFQFVFQLRCEFVVKPMLFVAAPFLLSVLRPSNGAQPKEGLGKKKSKSK